MKTPIEALKSLMTILETGGYTTGEKLSVMKEAREAIDEYERFRKGAHPPGFEEFKARSFPDPHPDCPAVPLRVLRAEIVWQAYYEMRHARLSDGEAATAQHEDKAMLLMALAERCAELMEES